MRRLVLACFWMVVGIVFIALSFRQGFAVYEEDLPESETAFYEVIDERALTEDATFGGVVLSALTDRLITTYDRSKPKGRPACPT